MENKHLKVALIGNPNTGKSSVYNLITNQNQPVGNFVGVTVDKKKHIVTTPKNNKIEIIDFPGTYSIFPQSEDEKVVFDILKNPSHVDFPDVVLFVCNSTQIQRNLLLFFQLQEIGIPIIMLLNMTDKLRLMGKKIDYIQFQNILPNVPIIPINARLKSDKNNILDSLDNYIENPLRIDNINSNYLQNLNNDIDLKEKDTLNKIFRAKEIDSKVITQIQKNKSNTFTKKIDKILTHNVGGYLILLTILFGIFQLIFKLTETPMEWIDTTFNFISVYTSQILPQGILTDLLTQGLIPGLGGVIIFIPQIAILFLCIGILEETGYMSRAVFLMDRWMRPLGLSGKSVLPLVSSIACAIPGILSARTITGEKNRLISILVAPFMSCSARIPVYTILISVVIPDYTVLGFINLKGLTLLFLYLLGTFMALFAAWILNLFIKEKNKDIFMLELPFYGLPNLGNLIQTVFFKTKDFVLGAGKIILAISIILWFLASFSPVTNKIENEIAILQNQELSDDEKDARESSIRLENSYIGILGKSIEPAIAPLGYDWKIGIALITSFAAREVFVGTLSTIYSVGKDSEESLIEMMKNDTKLNGQKVYSVASGMSLMIFYVFAMQCMATLAVVKRETRTWKWPLIQLIAMGILAYFSSWITFLILQ
jgi:ferrous iron transport protein B